MRAGVPIRPAVVRANTTSVYVTRDYLGNVMGAPISVRLDEDVHGELEADARARGIGLATLLRELAREAALEARRARIRRASALVGSHAAASPEDRALYESSGTPGTDGG